MNDPEQGLDSNYLKETVGVPLTIALAEIAVKRPVDPIHYLGHWLLKYRYNEESRKEEQQEAELLARKRDEAAKEIERQKAYEEYLEAVRKQEEHDRKKAEIEAERVRLEEEEEKANRIKSKEDAIDDEEKEAEGEEDADKKQSIGEEGIDKKKSVGEEDTLVKTEGGDEGTSVKEEGGSESDLEKVEKQGSEADVLEKEEN